ncbi:unnamed protein product [Rhodiola kirilowii]
MLLHSIVRDVRKMSFKCLSRRSGGKSHGPVDELQEQIKQPELLLQNSRWATLPPEILLNVIKRLDESDDSTWPAKKHVEACAAVCKSWRRMMMCKGRPEFCGKTTFLLVSLKQPGETFQCFIKRDKANMTFHLFISLSPHVLPVENGKFIILSAKGTHRGTHTEYIISSDADNISCSSSSYVGKIRCNFIRNKFIIYDSQPQPCTHIPTTSSSARRFLSKKISPKVPTGSYNIAQVTYKVNLTGVIQPRKMNCIMHSIPASALDVGDRVAGQTPLKPQNVEDSFRNLSLSKSVDCPTDYCNKSKPFVLKNKQPRWHEQLQCWCLNFHGRVHVASVKNFQLIDDRDPAADIGSHVYLQFGRVSKDKETFTMDYKYPLSAFQAFAICLSSFSNKLLCDH